MEVEDLTEKTIRERVRFIQIVERKVGPLMQITRHDLIAFLAADKTWLGSTKQHYKSALHTFFTWLQDEEIRLDNPAARLPKVKSRKKDPNPLTPEEIERTVNGGAYKKTRIMVALHYNLGLRVSEIASLHGSMINWSTRVLTILVKGKKTKRKPINDAMWELIQDMPRDGFWFPNWLPNRLYPEPFSGHILGGSVSRNISDLMKRAAVLGHVPHDLRASTATEQNNAGVDVFTIKENMGHESVATTGRYTAVKIEQQRAGFNALPVVRMPTQSNRQKAA
jgi:site-specific recombinase XerD